MNPGSDHERDLARLRNLAGVIVTQLGPVSGISFGYDRDSVAWVEGFIERQRERRDPAEGAPDGLVTSLGAFLGECLVRATGGAWVWDDVRGAWCVTFPNGAGAYPFTKVRKQFENGLSDTVLGFYDVAVRFVAAGKLG